MITIEGFWIVNGKKEPIERQKEFTTKQNLEQFRKELAKEMKCEPLDIIFKYVEK